MAMDNFNNASGKRKITQALCLGVGLLTGVTLVSTPTACNPGNVRISREPLAQTGEQDIDSRSPSINEERLEVEPEIEQVSANTEPTVSGEDPRLIKSDASLFAVKAEPEFCSGLKPGECLTLVIQVPSTLLQSSLGLGVLGLSLASKGYNDLLHRTCGEGLKVGLPVIEAGLPLVRRNGVAKGLFGGFKRARCLYQVLTDEGQLPPQLSSNETGLKVRLVDFTLSGSAISTNPVIGKFEFKESKLNTRFHDVSLRIPQAGQSTTWEPVRGGWNIFDTATYSGIFKTSNVNVTVNRGLVFKANGFGIASYLNTVVEPFLDESTRTQSLVKARAQVEMMRMAVRALRQGKSMVTSSLVLVGMGLDAIKQLCSSPGSDCRVQNSERDLVTQLNASFDNGEPLESNSKALLIDALKYVPLGLVRAVFEHADEKALVAQMRPPLPAPISAAPAAAPAPAR
ncbi:MAG: hypothetical protein FJY29_05415 [Betaproteobacteria bacterium]|nr:hypothetical protein [Betaproteobacteria bacterium]